MPRSSHVPIADYVGISSADQIRIRYSSTASALLERKKDLPSPPWTLMVPSKNLPTTIFYSMRYIPRYTLYYENDMRLPHVCYGAIRTSWEMTCGQLSSDKNPNLTNPNPHSGFINFPTIMQLLLSSVDQNYNASAGSLRVSENEYKNHFSKLLRSDLKMYRMRIFFFRLGR